MQRFLITSTNYYSLIDLLSYKKTRTTRQWKPKCVKFYPSRRRLRKKLARSDIVIRTENNIVQGEFAAINVAQCKGIQIPESREFLIVESGIMGLAILNTAQRIRNPSQMRLESGIQVQLIKNHSTETSTWNPESTGWIQDCLGLLHMGWINGMNCWWSQIHSKLWPYTLLFAVHPD